MFAALPAFALNADGDGRTSGADVAIERGLRDVVRHVGYVGHQAALSVSWASASKARSGVTDVLTGRTEAVGETEWRAIGQGRPQAVSQMRAEFGISESAMIASDTPAIVISEAQPRTCMATFQFIDDLHD